MAHADPLCFRLVINWRTLWQSSRTARWALASSPFVLLVLLIPLAMSPFWAWSIDEVCFFLSMGMLYAGSAVIEICHVLRIAQGRRNDRLTLDAEGMSFVSTSAFRKSWQLSWTDIRLPVLVCADAPAMSLLLDKVGTLALLAESGLFRLDCWIFGASRPVRRFRSCAPSKATCKPCILPPN
ncbi:MAG: hypothetical protein LBO79_05000 [Zoogloeaceae bacterium]|nr:hypothetical protein [Zoogloeaceae bacterium]